MKVLLDYLPDGQSCNDYLVTVREYWQSCGWLAVPLGLVCFLILYRTVVLRRRLKASLLTPSTFMVELQDRLHRDRTRSSLSSWLAGLPGAKARIAGDLIAYTRMGIPFREAYRLCRNAELAPYTQAFTFLAALVAAAPLLGLLGTVLGMVETFDAVARQSSETTRMVAGGISQALITTQAGLVTALPGTFGVAHLYRLYRRLKSDIEGSESQLRMMLRTLEDVAETPERRAREVA